MVELEAKRECIIGRPNQYYADKDCDECKGLGTWMYEVGPPIKRHECNCVKENRKRDLDALEKNS